MGGSPLNNEVWVLESVVKVDREPPMTRAMFLNHTYELKWRQLEKSPWAPRSGMAVISQFYFNESIQDKRDSSERLVMIGGFGGWTQEEEDQDKMDAKRERRKAAKFYTGFRCMNEVWGFDGFNWTLITDSPAFPPRAWFGLSVFYSLQDPRLDGVASAHTNGEVAPRLWLFGGGFIGTNIVTREQTQVMTAYYDAWYSRDGITWTLVNYQEGGATRAYIEVLAQ